MNVRAARRFANRVEAAFAQLTFQPIDRFKVRAAFSQPIGKRWLRETRARRVDLHERFGSHKAYYGNAGEANDP